MAGDDSETVTGLQKPLRCGRRRKEGADEARLARRREHFRAYYKKNRELLLARGREYRKSWSKRAWILRSKYGLTPEDVQRCIEAQEGACALCGRVGVKFVVDHDHSDGRVRGMLCSGCNTLEGRLGRRSDGWFHKLQDYRAHGADRVAQILGRSVGGKDT
jgi:hypothetical protein